MFSRLAASVVFIAAVSASPLYATLAATPAQVAFGVDVAQGIVARGDLPLGKSRPARPRARGSLQRLSGRLRAREGQLARQA